MESSRLPYSLNEFFKHATAGTLAAVADVSDHICMDNIGGEVAVGLDTKHAGDNGTSGLQVAVAELGDNITR